jgi:hypothetical protein
MIVLMSLRSRVVLMRWCVDVVMIVVDALMILAVAVWTVREAS